MYITAPEPISTTYFLNPFYQFVYLYVYPLLIARQRLGRNVTAAANTYATIEQLTSLYNIYVLHPVVCHVH
jgi:hypothetical protein